MDKNKPGKVGEGRPYLKRYNCSNCGETFTKTFVFGERASKGACTNCGVADRNERFLHKMFKNEK